VWLAAYPGEVAATAIQSRNILNNIAVGCVLLGLIGPLATGKYAHFLTLEFVYSEGAAWVLAAVLHMIARRQLSLLEE
jgi:hypothetical protein